MKDTTMKSRRWRAAHPEQKREDNKAYYQAHREDLLKRANDRNMQKRIEQEQDQEQWY